MFVVFVGAAFKEFRFLESPRETAQCRVPRITKLINGFNADAFVGNSSVGIESQSVPVVDFVNLIGAQGPAASVLPLCEVASNPNLFSGDDDSSMLPNIWRGSQAGYIVFGFLRELGGRMKPSLDIKNSSRLLTNILNPENNKKRCPLISLRRWAQSAVKLYFLDHPRPLRFSECGQLLVHQRNLIAQMARLILEWQPGSRQQRQQRPIRRRRKPNSTRTATTMVVATVSIVRRWGLFDWRHGNDSPIWTPEDSTWVLRYRSVRCRLASVAGSRWMVMPESREIERRYRRGA